MDMHGVLKDAISKSRARNKSRAAEALAKIEGYHKAVAVQLFKSVSRLSLSV